MLDLVAVRAGVLVASRRIAPADAAAAVAELRAAAEAAPAVTHDDGPPEEVEVVTSWLHTDGVTIHHCSGEFASTVVGGRGTEAVFRRLTRVHRSTGRAAAELEGKRRRRDHAPPVDESDVVDLRAVP